MITIEGLQSVTMAKQIILTTTNHIDDYKSSR